MISLLVFLFVNLSVTDATGWMLVSTIGLIAYGIAPAARFTTWMVFWHKRTWPLAGPGFLAMAIDGGRGLMTGHHPVGDAITLVVATWCLLDWWKMRNWPDDQFDKRAKAVLGVVRSLGHRLTVEPEPEQA